MPTNFSNSFSLSPVVSQVAVYVLGAFSMVKETESSST
jgi:hypothetical protein